MLLNKYENYLAVNDFESIFNAFITIVDQDDKDWSAIKDVWGAFIVLYETIPECINSIEPDSLWELTRGNEYLETFKIPDSVISIGDYAFFYCNLHSFHRF